jgi:16S rRNA G966 N2-methylase RsmD
VTRDAWFVATRGADEQPFELLFLDPPYRDSEDSSDRGAVRRYLARLGELEENKPLVVLHHSAGVRFESGPGDVWRVVDQRTFGTSSVSFFTR